MMRAVRLHPPGGIDALSVDEIEVPQPDPGEALVRVHAAAITRDELDWPTDRLPAIVSYELSGVVEQVVGPATPFGESIEPVDLVFDTVGGEALARSADVLRAGGRLVAVTQEPPPEIAQRVHAIYFVVEPDRQQLVELAKLATDG